MVQVIGVGAPRLAMRAPADRRISLPVDGTAPVEVAVPPRLAGQVRLELSEPPEGVSIQSVSSGREGMTLLLRVEGAKAKPGLKGNLIVNAFVDRPVNGPARAAVRQQPIGTLPAIPFEIVGSVRR
jgi:hypothetical protein